MHPKGIDMHPKVSIDLHPTSAYFAPDRAIDMHPKGIDFVPKSWDKKWASDWSGPNNWKFWFGEAAILVNLGPLGPDVQGLASAHGRPPGPPNVPLHLCFHHGTS